MSISATTVVWFLVSTVQGMTIGQLTNVFGFRSRSLLTQFSLSAFIALSLVPWLDSVVALAGGLSAPVFLNVAFVIALLAIVLKRRKRFQRLCKILPLDLKAHRPLIFAAVVWILVSLFVLLDVQFGHRLFDSLTLYDHQHKVGVVDDILRGAIPPDNSVFYPGHAVPLLYHYYWALLCAVMSQMIGSAADTRIVVLSGVVWTGLAFIACIEVCAAFFSANRLEKRRLQILTIALVVVSNLYVLIVLPMNLLISSVSILHIGWWTCDQLCPILILMLWLPHNVASLMAGMLGSILLIDLKRFEHLSAKVVSITLAAGCIASSFGLCVFVGVTFAIAWVIWTIACLARKKIVECVTITCAGLLSLFLILQFLHSFPSSSGASFPLTLGVRSFELIYLLPMPSKTSWLYPVLLTCALPLNYLLGYGFILVGALGFWKERLFSSRPSPLARLSDKDVFLLVAAVSSLILSSFVRSSHGGNDFGWRAIILAQFAFLLWSGQYVLQRLQGPGKKKLSQLAVFLIGVGLSTSVYALYLDRTSLNLLVDAGRTYSIRSLYSQLDKQLPQTSIMQHNPHLISRLPVELFAILYSHRRVVCNEFVEDPGGPELPDLVEYKKVCKQVISLFEDADAETAISICQNYKINVLFVRDTDKIWSNKTAWIWKFPVIAQNDHARAFLIRN